MSPEEFNQLSVPEAKKRLAHCVALESWIEALVAARPFASLESLLQTGDRLARGWDGLALDKALSAHPRIGEKARGDDKEASLSRNEQGSVQQADSELKQALRSGNATYEQRFGRVFLIRAKGRSGEEMLAELHRRLGNDPQSEQREALDQLREITLLRLRDTFQ
ncbi:2-oxo-4-hydroxy-4-carboxy-5-ureidoimidazoline decarboxylase [Kalamiella sp. sgz302252]|uniref:2-oxo-4-hydroxy-4-carboxy-5-ureidoimidazoline decarboxylase n=1 Tax=Pantoea sp. sgz302252 TaxID=3341827 RepID=UPI0036D347D7